jgi:hypothetical protein
VKTSQQTSSRCAGSYQLPPVAITHLQRLSTGFPLPPPGVSLAFRTREVAA